MNAIAERYVKLVLAVGQHDAAYVDAYYGPTEWRAEANRQNRPLSDIGGEANALVRDLRARPTESDAMLELRHEYSSNSSMR